MTDSQIARWLIARQNFSPSEGPSTPEHNWPSPAKTCFIVLGNNLFETLLLNIIAKFNNRIYQNKKDRAIWEMDKLDSPNKEGNAFLGFANLMTWPTRFFCLRQDGTMLRYGGWAVPDGIRNPTVINKRNKDGELKSVNPEPNRLWQHYTSFYADETSLPALVELSKIWGKDQTVSLSIYAAYMTLINNEAKIKNVGESRLKWFCLEHLQEGDRVNIIERLENAAQVANTIWKAASVAVKKMDEEGWKQKEKKSKRFVFANEIFSCFNNYWSQSEQLFWSKLDGCLKTASPKDAVLDAFGEEWVGQLKDRAKYWLDQFINMHSSSIDPRIVFGTRGIWHCFHGITKSV